MNTIKSSLQKTHTMEIITNICTVFSILFQLAVPDSMHFCSGTDGKPVCCYGYKLNPEQNSCIGCNIGFFGNNCAITCPFPTYGEDCQSLCNCTVTNCDHVNGCTQSSGEQPNYNIVTKPDRIDKVNIDKVSSRVMADNTTNVHTTQKTQNKRITTLKFALLGLAALSLILIILYIYTRLLEKNVLKTNTV